MKVTSLIKFIIINVLLFCLFAVFVKPQIIATIYNKTYPATFTPVDPNDLEDVKIIDYEKEYKIYRFNETTAEENSPIVVFISGGFFVRSAPELDILNRLSKKRIVVAFTYPVRFGHTTQDMREFVKRVICDYITVVYPTKEIVLVSYSAGALLSLLFINDNYEQKLGIKIKKFIGVNGFYGSSSVSNLLYKLPALYYIQSFGKIDPPLKLENDDISILTCKRDFIKQSSLNMASVNFIKPEIFEGDHVTFLKSYLPESLKMIDRVNEIIESE